MHMVVLCLHVAELSIEWEKPEARVLELLPENLKAFDGIINVKYIYGT